MKVYKFGGASVSSPERIQHLGNMLAQESGEKIIIVISAIGKTTNALEKVAEAFYAGRREEALALFEAIKKSHVTLAKFLLVKLYNQTLDQLINFFTEVEWMLHDKPVRAFDYYYDQIVCAGELLSSSIFSAYLNETGIRNQWVDVRDLVRTDNSFRKAAIDWSHTALMITRSVPDAMDQSDLLITQGFIGSTDENESTTLGREGSDYTAAVFANILNAESLTVWKDVHGVMDADPDQFSDAGYIPELHYNQAVEMAFYGAKVIHPATIKPLQNKNIALYVKSFLDPALPGTLICSRPQRNIPPIRILKNNQALIFMVSKDFSFIDEGLAEIFFHLLKEHQLSPKFIQTGALKIIACVDDQPEQVEKLALGAAAVFDVRIEKGFQLLTILHYTDEIATKMTDEKNVIMKQQTADTLQIVLKE